MNKTAKLAGRASVVNIVAWLLLAIPGFLNSRWSVFEIVIIPLSALIALVAGIIGLMSREKMEEKGVGKCVIGILLGVLNVVLLSLVLIGIYGMVHFS